MGSPIRPCASRRRSRPSRSVTRKPPSGNNATDQGCERLCAIVSTRMTPPEVAAGVAAVVVLADATAGDCCALQAQPVITARNNIARGAMPVLLVRNGSTIACGLQLEQFRIPPALRQQLRVRAAGLQASFG